MMRVFFIFTLNDGKFHVILLVPHNIVVELNNLMGHVLVRGGELEGTLAMRDIFKLHVYVHILRWCGYCAFVGHVEL